MPAKFFCLRSIKSGMFCALCMKRRWLQCVKLLVLFFPLLNSMQKCNEYFSSRSCKVIPSKAVKRSSIKSYCSQKKKSLSCVFDLPYEICRQTAFHIIPYCSQPTVGLMTAVNYKMADLSRGAKKDEKGGEGWQKHTLVTQHRPRFCSSSPWDQTGGRIWTSKSFPSSGELSGPAE